MGAQDSTQVPPPVTTVGDPTVETPEEKISRLERERDERSSAETLEDSQTETPEEKLRRVENERDALKVNPGSVAPSVPAGGNSDPNVDLGAIEPGLKWAIRNKLVDPATIGPHIVQMLEDGLI